MYELSRNALAVTAGVAVGVGGVAAANELNIDLASAQPVPQERTVNMPASPAISRFGGTLAFSGGQFSPKSEVAASVAEPVAKKAGSLDPPFEKPYACSESLGVSGPRYFKAAYHGTSKQDLDYRIKMWTNYTCKPNGTRIVKIYQERELNGEFSKNSSTVKFNAGVTPKDKKGKINAPFDCNAPNNKIRAAVVVHWKAKKGRDNEETYYYPIKKPNCN